MLVLVRMVHFLPGEYGMSFSGLRVRFWRHRRGLTQGELAIRLGVTQAHLSRMERGVRLIPSSLEDGLLSVLGVSSSDLVGYGLDFSGLSELDLEFVGCLADYLRWRRGNSDLGVGERRSEQ